jgi:hypothetical protein
VSADIVTVHRTIKARPATVFSFFTDRAEPLCSAQTLPGHPLLARMALRSSSAS